MPREKNKAARIIVPIVAIVVGALIVYGVLRGTTAQRAAEQTATQAEQAPHATNDAAHDAASTRPETSDQPAPPEPEAQAPPEPPETPAAGADERDGPPAPQGLRARLNPASAAPLKTMGSTDPDGDMLAEVSFTPIGAGVESITLARYSETLGGADRFEIQSRKQADGFIIASLAARSVRIDDQVVDLYASGRADAWIWRETAPGAFEAMIVDADDNPVARITRRYRLTPASYDIRVEQTLHNLTGRDLAVRWIQYGPVDLPEDETRYIGDMRRVTFGHLLPDRRDPSRQLVDADKQRSRRDVIDKPLDPNGLLWPTPEAEREGLELVWAAMTNRYFAFAVHTPVTRAHAESGQPIDKRFLLGERVYRRVLGAGGQARDRVVMLELHSAELVAPADGVLDLSMGVYAGPLWRKTLGAEAIYTSLGLQKLVVYTLGGMCAFCTFQWLAVSLLWFLGVARDYLVFDWALAIMLLVVVVRGILHPVTKKSQISIQRFSKQMQALAPKQKKLQEKYKDDKKKLQQEMAKLMREEGVNFTGALGCLPLFLQSPIWIALYAMLFFAFDLRHEPAFFGLFQVVSAGHWSFLSDLSAPDRFIDFGSGFSLPLVSGLIGEIRSINILPLFLGVVFYVQQKYLTPQTANLTPEQETQQKIMKVMMVVMFPVIMYNAPSGLSLYFITNSALGILESRYIRAHVNQMDLEPKKPAGPGKPKRVRNQATNPFRKAKPDAPKFKPRGKKR